LADLAMSELEVQRARRADASKRRMLELAEVMSGVGHWRLEVASGAVSWSDEVYRIHGLDRAAFDPALDSALRFYAEDDAEMLAGEIARAVAEKTGFSFELKLRRADGAWRDVLAKAACELNTADQVVALIGVFQDVTEPKALLRQVGDERERYRLLTQNSTDVIAAYTPGATFTYLSPAITKLTGRAPEELVGRKTFAVIHPDDVERVKAEFAALLHDGGASARIEYRAMHRDGGCRWVEAHPRPIFDAEGKLIGFQDVVRDIGTRREAQAEAAEALGRAQHSEAGYRLLAENANDMIALTSTDDAVIQFVSPGCRRVLGYEPEELVGRPTLALTHPEDRAPVMRHFLALLEAGPTERVAPYQFRGLHKDGSWLWLEGQPRVRWDAQGRPVCFQDVVRDISQRKQLERRLEQLRAEAEAGARTKTDFLANMSHELRTPLTGILGYADVLACAPELGEESRGHLERIRRSGETLMALVNDVMDLSKIEAGGLALEPRPVDLLPLLRGAVDSVWPQAAAKGLRLRADLPDAPVHVSVDPGRVRQVVLNLLGNAVKFTDAGEVTLSLAVAEDAAGGPTQLVIGVADTGIGVSAAQLARIFGRFEQADASITRRFGGTGLGLAISHAIAERMGGELRARSTPGRGSTFELVLRAAAVAPRAEAPAAAPSDGPSPLAGRRVLLAEDVALNRDLIGLLLGRCGARVSFAEDGAEAVVAAAREPFDAILMDMQMPVLDGVEATRRIRSNPGPNARTPIVALTANVLPSEVAQCRAAGMDGHVAKPFTVQTLTAALDHVIAQRAQAVAARASQPG
jgi:PAS domain S-box-containing protein